MPRQPATIATLAATLLFASCASPTATQVIVEPTPVAEPATSPPTARAGGVPEHEDQPSVEPTAQSICRRLLGGLTTEADDEALWSACTRRYRDLGRADLGALVAIDECQRSAPGGSGRLRCVRELAPGQPPAAEPRNRDDQELTIGSAAACNAMGDLFAGRESTPDAELSDRRECAEALGAIHRSDPERFELIADCISKAESTDDGMACAIADGKR